MRMAPLVRRISFKNTNFKNHNDYKHCFKIQGNGYTLKSREDIHEYICTQACVCVYICIYMFMHT